MINIDGFNEIALSIRNEELGLHPLYPSAGFWSHFARGRQVDPEALDLQLATWSLQREARRVALDALEGEEGVVGAFLWKWFPGESRGEDFLMSTPAMREVIGARWR